MHTKTCIVIKALLICMKILEILRYMLRWSQGTANRSILHSVCVLHDFLNILLHALLLLLSGPLHLLPLLLLIHLLLRLPHVHLHFPLALLWITSDLHSAPVRPLRELRGAVEAHVLLKMQRFVAGFFNFHSSAADLLIV